MTCESVRFELEAFARRDLDAKTEAAVREHVSGCAGCRAALADVKVLVRALEALPPEEVDADALADRVLARARRSASGRTPPPRRSVAAPLVVTALLGGAAVLAIVHRGPPETTGTAPERAPAPALPSAPAAPTVPPAPALPVVPAAPPTPESAPVPSTATPEHPAPPSEPPSRMEELTSKPETPPREEPTPGAPPPPPPPSPREDPAPPVPPSVPALACSVASVPGEARVRKKGGAATSWQPLALDALLEPGDEVTASKGTLELAFARPGAPRDGVLALDRLVLATGSHATLAPDERSSARVDSGEVFVSTASPFVLLAGQATLTLEGCDASISCAKAGGVSVAAHAGRVAIDAAGKRTTLEAGQGVSLDKAGKAGRAVAAPDLPKWLAAHRVLDPSRVVCAYRPGDEKAPPLLVGERSGDLVRGGTTPKKGPGTRVVCVGRGDAAGLAVHETGLRLRVRYRLGKVVPFGLQVTETAHAKNFQAALAAPRAGVWTVVDFELDALAGELDHAARLAPGDHLDLVTLSAHGDDPALDFEVSEILIYRPR